VRRVLEVLKVLVPRVLTVLMVLGVSVGAQSPAPAAGDGAIAGQVVDAGTGKPVSGVVVSVSGPSMAPRRTSTINASGGLGFSMSPGVSSILTSADGRFLFRDLPPGSFTVTATKGGYADGASGRKRIGGAAQPVLLTADDKAADIVVRVWKNSAITGTVTDEAGEPVVGLQVRVLARTASLSAPESRDPAFVRLGIRPFVTTVNPVLTDDRGVYRFGDLTPGEYIVVAGPPLTSATRSIFSDNRSGAGSRDLLALMGNGTAGASVQVGDALVAVGRGAAVPPPPAGGRIRVYPPTFYPSGLVAGQATTIALGSGEDRSAIDIQLAPVATARVSGTLMSAGGPLEMETLRLVPAGAEGIPLDIVAPASVTNAAGEFIFAAVVPGRYTLHGSTSGGAAGMSFLDLPVTVGDNIDGLLAAMSPAVRITGRYQFDGTTPPPTSATPGRPVMQVPFILDPADSVSVLDQLRVSIFWGDRGFIVDGYPPGRYRVRVPNSPQGWMFKAAMLNGVDVSETPFELTRNVDDLVVSFTDRWSGVGGTVQGTGSDGASVLVFPTEAQKWTTAGWNPRRLRSARANAKGQFGLSSLPPGDYYVVAVQEEPPGDWRDPASLDALARIATQITILEGEHKTIDLRVREVPR
jgi:Carboxypeptidase regulatory-like domain